MSRIGFKPIPVPSGVEVTIKPGNVHVKGPKGELNQVINPELIVKQENGTLEVQRQSEKRKFQQLHGLTRTLVANMVEGVTEGFKKDLEIQGVGYRASLEGKTLVLNVGYSHPVRMEPDPGIEFSLESPTRITVSGIDKQLVGEIAARIRRVR